ncbi:hypothetical protein RJ639_012050, partial [Escallonia herrerae]
MEEMGKVLELLVKCSKEGGACNLSTELMTMSSSITARMSMSTRCSESYNGSKKIRELPNEIRDQSQHREEREGDNGDRRRKDVMEILMEIHEDGIAEVKISRNNIKAFLLVILQSRQSVLHMGHSDNMTTKLLSPQPSLALPCSGSLESTSGLREGEGEGEVEGEPDTKAQNLEYAPFGSGRRACPGAGLAQRVMHEMIGTLVQCFDFKVKGREKVDTTEGVATDMAQPL